MSVRQPPLLPLPSAPDGPLSTALTLESLELGAHPLIEPLLERVGLRGLLEEALAGPRSRVQLAPAEVAVVLVRNFTLSRHPLYGVPQWARRVVPAQLGLSPEQLALINDDRLARLLDRLFNAERRSLLTRLMVRTVQAFDLDLERLHNDTTSLTFSGLYANQSARGGRRGCAHITYGHNKDHRPDLKQLVWSLSVTHDGAVPVHYNLFDGNLTDDQTHIEVWKALCEIVGRCDFLYVADSKLCTRHNMAFIHSRAGRFITVLPRSRKEDGRFKAWCVHHGDEWELIWERAPRRRRSAPPERFEALDLHSAHLGRHLSRISARISSARTVS